MKALRLLLICCAGLMAKQVSAAPPVSASSPLCPAVPLSLYTPGVPGTFAVPMVVPVVVPAAPEETAAVPAPGDPSDKGPEAGPGVEALFAPNMFGTLFSRGRFPPPTPRRCSGP